LRLTEARTVPRGGIDHARASAAELVVRVAFRNTRADTATVDSNAATCHPPLYFRTPSGARTVAWSDHRHPLRHTLLVPAGRARLPEASA